MNTKAGALQIHIGNLWECALLGSGENQGTRCKKSQFRACNSKIRREVVKGSAYEGASQPASQQAMSESGKIT
jgi:hypothetical protein